MGNNSIRKLKRMGLSFETEQRPDSNIVSTAGIERGYDIRGVYGSAVTDQENGIGPGSYFFSFLYHGNYKSAWI